MIEHSIAKRSATTPATEPLLVAWQERVRTAAAEKTHLCLCGGGSKTFYGNEPSGTLFDTRAYCGIVAYEPTELVITARCGTPLGELEATLAEHRQMLAFEPPHFCDAIAGGSATVGGATAAGLSGPRRLQAGPLRDFVLGTRLLDGQGRVVEFGGQVMKNVAGYDVSRLLAGSLGVLGVILEVSLKVLPLPAVEITLQRDADEDEALRLMNRWRGLPLPISATAWQNGMLAVRLSGAGTAVTAASQKLAGAIVDPEEARAFWRDLREQQMTFFTEGGAPLWRLSLPATAAPLNMGNTLIEWSGGQRWLRSTAPSDEIRARAAEAGGNATRFRGDGIGPAFAPLPATVMRLHQRLKAQFDPAAIFNPDRLYPGL